MSKKNSGLAAESVPPLKRIGSRVLRVPGSKSLTLRATVLGALGAGRSVLTAPLESDDTLLLAEALQAIGVGVKWTPNKLVLHGVDGKPRHGASVNLGAGGTPSRIMIAVGALSEEPLTVDGDSRMRSRPVGELTKLLTTLKASCEGESLPVTVSKGDCSGGLLDIPATKSSQFISALLLIAPYLSGGLTLRCEKPVTSSTYIDLTVETLKTFGVSAAMTEHDDYLEIVVPETRLTHRELDIEPDASSAVYFAAIAAIHEGMAVTLEGLSLDSSQPDMEAIRLLVKAGATLEEVEHGVKVTGTGTIRAFGDLDASGFPDASLCLAAVAAFADGPSRIYGLETLPIKESDRIEVMAKSLALAGCGVASSDSDLRISPLVDGSSPIAIDPMNDHRIAMSMAVLGTKRGNLSIVDPSCVSKSYPTFWKDLRKIYEGKNES
ncbi:MAG: 3-phosphoshikimate 1-carboxyvinyltransferase [Phycisphaerales bacterium]|nr:3-phosphoshikimate 1-carboxyvinyltransferase [Phycisphaerales bacterium]